VPPGGSAPTVAAVELIAGDGEQAIDALAAALAAAVPGATTATTAGIGRGLRQREALGSTALGGGVALPHCRVSGLERSVVVVARLRSGVDYGAPDGAPVRLFVAIATPAEQPGSHLRLLADLARRLRDRGQVERLLETDAVEELATALLPGPTRRSA
jgi:PTS system nitrogen regulatory IIA component